jgi:hypothetical protein
MDRRLSAIGDILCLGPEGTVIGHLIGVCRLFRIVKISEQLKGAVHLLLLSGRLVQNHSVRLRSVLIQTCKTSSNRTTWVPVSKYRNSCKTNLWVHEYISLAVCIRNKAWRDAKLGAERQQLLLRTRRRPTNQRSYSAFVRWAEMDRVCSHANTLTTWSSKVQKHWTTFMYFEMERVKLTVHFLISSRAVCVRTVEPLYRRCSNCHRRLRGAEDSSLPRVTRRLGGKWRGQRPVSLGAVPPCSIYSLERNCYGTASDQFKSGI